MSHSQPAPPPAQHEEPELPLTQTAASTTAESEEVAGLLELVELHDFLCHRFLQVRLGSKLNFVIGHNGSGKSAILTAIAVCLGGKATFTNRGSSVREFIRSGCTAGRIVVHLSNRGPDAYLPDVFGERIVVERRITQGSGSGYKLKSASGQVVSTAREALTRVLDHFMIDIENPLIVLTQDMARRFLAGSTARDKYAFFTQGTHVERLASATEQVVRNIETAERESSFKADELRQLKRRIRDSEAQVRYFERRQERERKRQRLNAEQVWAAVGEREEALRKLEEAADNAATKAERAAAREAEARAAAEAAQDEEAARREALERKAEAAREAAAAAQRAEGEHARAEASLEDVKRDQTTTETDMQHQERLKTQLEADLAGLVQQLRDDERRVVEKQQSQLAELDTAVSDAKAREAALADERRAAEDAQRRHQAAAADAERELLRLREQRSENEQAIADLEQRRHNRLLAYGQGMPAVLGEVSRIASRGGWRGATPVGPYGAHLSLRHAQWQSVIESVIAPALSAFAVETRQDARQLDQIFSKYNVRATAFCVTRPRDFSRRLADGEPDSALLTIRRAMTIDDPLVEASLVINHQIEKVILVEAHAEADRIMTSGPNGRPPANVRACYTVDGFSVGHAQGGLATQVLRNRARGASKLAVSIDDEIARVRKQLRQLDPLGSAASQSAADARTAAAAAAAETARIERDQEEARDARRRCERKRRELTAVMDERQTRDVGGLRAEIAEAQKAISTAETQREHLENLKLDRERECARLQRDADALGREAAALRAEFVTERAAVEELVSRRAQYDSDAEHYRRAQAASALNAETHASNVEAARSALDEQMRQCLAVCERVDVTHTRAELAAEVERLERLMERDAPPSVSHETLLAELAIVHEQYAAGNALVRANRALVANLKTAAQWRMQMWKEFRDYLAQRTTALFARHVARRFPGAVEFDHAAETLDVRLFAPEETAGGAPGRSARALSGGEKSFATICLLLAIWDTMSCPLRCLDEFDVFMDSVNRKMAMQMLMDYAQELVHPVQFILITPQAIGGVRANSAVRIHRLADPERLSVGAS